jgi:hypothetical protein
MAQIPETSTLPLSIAQVDSTVYVEPGVAAALASGNAADAGLVHQQLLSAVTARAGEVEAAEWALDQAKAARDGQIVAALFAGVPFERVAAAAGMTVPDAAGPDSALPAVS